MIPRRGLRMKINTSLWSLLLHIVNFRNRGSSASNPFPESGHAAMIRPRHLRRGRASTGMVPAPVFRCGIEGRLQC